MASKPTIAEEYDRKFAKSRQLYEEAVKVFPSGLTHDARLQRPFPVYMARAEGSKKWDVSGNEIIDYVMGHGSLMLGHKHPAVLAAANEQLNEGTHFGAPQEHEIEWGKMVLQLVPSAERVKFTSSGTEATMMALRLARAYTGRTKVIKFEAHFHGWHDYATVSAKVPFDLPSSAGIPKETQSTMLSAPASDIEAVEALIDQGDVAAVILEPTGASMGTVPTKEGFLPKLRELTAKKDVVLIFDEVVTGFRCSPGGAQAYYNVMPDLTTLAKVLAGGFPGGAVAGKNEIMSLLEIRDDPSWNRGRRISHPGTYNANPLSSAAGTAALKVVATGEPHKIANRLAAQLRDSMNEIIKSHGAPGCVYGNFSFFHVCVGPGCPTLKEVDEASGTAGSIRLMNGMGAFEGRMKQALLINGIDVLGHIGLVSGAHTDQDVEETLKGFDKALAQLKSEGSF